ncbi:CDP-alcohol phosphatidyltransferase family protein [Kiloniella sp. b19]|uniref:CDP-alcohol phosphatidyltransferase family protein n=1 Tax=Kiloniella sp. GXU_MW_B19 TaxID=3141326 RepID=UPI0031DB5C5E
MRRRARKKRLRGLSIARLVPNSLTLLGLCAGLSSIRAALEQNWELAVLGIVVAMVTDGLDGPAARLLKAQSEFGAQLDSLADFVNFGVAPALVVYLWALPDAGGFAWALAILFAICCAMRLARFNTGLIDENPPVWATKFFVGVPAPGGAGLMLVPMVLSFEMGDAFWRNEILNGALFVAVGALFVCTLPTFSSKRIHIPRKFVGLVMVAIAAYGAFLLSTPWIALALAGIGYGVSIILAQFSFRTMIRKMEAQKERQKARSQPDGSVDDDPEDNS